MVRRATSTASARLAFALTAGLSVAPASAQLSDLPLTITEIRVHGNQSLSSDEVLALTGISVGDQLTPTDLESLKIRLLASDQFDDVELRTRSRSLDPTEDVVLIVVVRERAGAGTSNPIRRALGPLGRRMLFLPILDYAEGYGVTYGARLAVVDVLGGDGRVSVPASLGGRKEVGLQLDRSFDEGRTRLQGGVRRIRVEHPHFEIDDDRTSAWLSAERVLPGNLRIGGRMERSEVGFGVLDDTVSSYDLALTFDTRRTASFPRDSLMAQVGFEWLDPASAPSVIGRLRYRAEAYRGLIGQSVLAARAGYQGADGPLPPFEKLLFGGGHAVRGWEVGAFLGDRLAVGSLELRIPLSSPFSIGETGVKVFYDTGTVFDAGRSIRDSRFRHGAGIGVFLKPPIADFGIDVAHNLVDKVRVHVVASLAF